MRSVEVIDPDGGARVVMREDLVLHITYPDGGTLLQVRVTYHDLYHNCDQWHGQLVRG